MPIPLWVRSVLGKNYPSNFRKAPMGVVNLLTDLLIFLLVVGSRFESLPWHTSAKEIHRNVIKRLGIVTSRSNIRN